MAGIWNDDIGDLQSGNAFFIHKYLDLNDFVKCTDFLSLIELRGRILKRIFGFRFSDKIFKNFKNFKNLKKEEVVAQNLMIFIKFGLIRIYSK